MRNLIIASAATAFLTCLSGAFSNAAAQDLPIRDGAEATASQASAEEAEADEAKKVCRSVQITGTRFRQRICRSQEEWDVGREAMREVAVEMRRDGADRVENTPTGPVASPQ